MVIIITNPSHTNEEHTTINQLFSEGLELLHLRKKELTEAQLREYIEAIPPKYYPKIKLHSHYHLAKEYGLQGIHVPLSFNQELGTMVSKSFHALEEIKADKSPFEYGFLSPIFDSISKEGYKNEFDFEAIKSYLSTSNQKIIALGGIDENRIATIKELQFSGIALLGAIWQNENPVDKFIQIRKRWN